MYMAHAARVKLWTEFWSWPMFQFRNDIPPPSQWQRTYITQCVAHSFNIFAGVAYNHVALCQPCLLWQFQKQRQITHVTLMCSPGKITATFRRHSRKNICYHWHTRRKCSLTYGCFNTVEGAEYWRYWVFKNEMFRKRIFQQFSKNRAQTYKVTLKERKGLCKECVGYTVRELSASWSRTAYFFRIAGSM